MKEKLKKIFLIKIKNIWRVSKILLFADSAILISVAMLVPIYAIFVQKIWWSLLDASTASWIFAIVAWLVTLISWHYVDKINNKVMIIIFWYFLTFLWFILYIFCNSIEFLFLIQVLIWFWEAISSPAFNTLYWKTLKEEYVW